MTKSQSPPTTIIPPYRVQLDHLKLLRFALFRDAAFSFKLPEDERAGQWTVFLGDNGVGKTTALRAIALLLMDNDIYRSLSGLGLLKHLEHTDELTSQRLKLKALTMQFDSPRTQHREVFERVRKSTHEREQKTESDAQAPEDPTGRDDSDALEQRTKKIFLLGYGGRRGSALGGAERDLDFRPLARVASLFDEGAELIHAETWLKQQRLKDYERKESGSSSYYNTILHVLCQVLPGVEEIEVSSEGVWVSNPTWSQKRIPLSALSDGYLTTMGWIVDMLARWLLWAEEHAEKGGFELPENFHLEMTGLVLIDEIDLHLHPRWQMRVIQDLRKLFPRMSFVVTTHNPLTLVGAKPGEVHVLSLDQKTGEVDVKQQDVPPGLRADQVLTGEWFGLSSTLEPETQDLLEEHRAMLRKQVDEDDEARQALEQTLRERLGNYAETSLERMALSLAAELTDERHASMTVEERQALRSQVKQRLQQRLKQRK